MNIIPLSLVLLTSSQNLPVASDISDLTCVLALMREIDEASGDKKTVYSASAMFYMGRLESSQSLDKLDQKIEIELKRLRETNPSRAHVRDHCLTAPKSVLDGFRAAIP